MKCYAKRLYSGFFALVIALLWQPVGYAQSEEARKGVEATNSELVAALGRGDAAAVAATYTADAQMLPPNGAVLSGRAAIQALWSEWIKAGFTKLTLEPTEIVGMGDNAYEVGKYVSTDGKTTDEGKYIVIWKRQQGKWRLYRDIWNTSLPAPEQK